MAAIQQERRSIDNLNPAEYNPRKRLQPGDEEYERLKSSIETFGYVDPIIINADGTVIGGHQRLFVLRDLGYSEADVAVVDLSKADEKALNIALNKIAGEWDEEKLAALFADLKAEDYDLALTGFGDDELAGIVSALTDSLQSELLGDPDEVPEAPKEPVTLLGDVWQIGRHRLMCGDSTSKECVERLMSGDKADMVFTDPPYGLSYSGGRSGGYNKDPHGQILNDDLQGKELGKLINNTFSFNNPEADVYICCSPVLQKPFLDWLEDNRKKLDAVIVWDKKAAGLGFMAYRRQCEFILFVKGGAFHKGDKSDFDLWSISKDNTATYVHGTQKPVAVPMRAIENSSKKGDAVLDLFGGSGSTLIACEQLKRTCYMMELDPKYCDVIVRRYMQVTGKKDVVLLRDGEEISVTDTGILN